MAASLGGLLTHLMRAGKENCNMAVSKVLGKETFFLFVCLHFIMFCLCFSAIFTKENNCDFLFAFLDYIQHPSIKNTGSTLNLGERILSLKT